MSRSTKTFTPKQGQYLAFIHLYTRLHRRSPAETDMQEYFRVSPPSVHQMVLTLERAGFIRRQPRIPRSIELLPICPKLKSYWHFYDCRYDKISGTCSEPDHIDGCPLPSHQLRNGRLNQMAYSLFLFIRDIADGDLVGWIDRQFQAADDPTSPDRLARLREALIGPLREVYGVSDKVLTMALSCILLAAPKRLQLWHEVGASMIAIDTLVHNFLVRTGILARFEADHSYGAACYQAGGCADIIAAIAQRIDARLFNPGFPQPFPRFIQHAIWRYCAQSGLDVCNGNRIDDRQSCTNVYCQIHSNCDRIVLNNTE